MIVKEIEQSLTQIVGGIYPKIDAEKIEITTPKDADKGDFTSAIAFVVAKEYGVSPVEVAHKLAESFVDSSFVAEAAGPYLNFTLTENDYMEAVSQKADGVIDLDAALTTQTVLVEHSSPNLFKPFHIGHLVNNTVGESVARLMKAIHGDVRALSYPSDVSLGIAKAVWGMVQKFPETLDSDMSLEDKMRDAGAAYAYGVQSYDDNPDVEQEIRRIVAALYNHDATSPYYDVYQKGRALNIAYFEKVVTRLGSRFDGYIFESEAGTSGKEIVRANIGSVFEESQGAVIFDGEAHDLHTRVFLNKEGFPTYEAKDIGLLSKKWETYKPDLSITVTDHEQGPYFQVVRKAAGMITPAWEEKMKHVMHGRLTLKGIKISSRLGNVPLAEDIIEGVVESTREKIAANENSRGEVDIDAVAIGALKFAILKVSLGKNMVFDPEQALSFEGDSGPYVQYTHARCSSIVTKAGELDIDNTEKIYDAKSHGVVWQLMSYEEAVLRATTDIAPHAIAQYLLELCHVYNKYYNDQKIIDEKDLGATAYRTQLTQAVAKTLAHGLDLLGITAPKEM